MNRLDDLALTYEQLRSVLVNFLAAGSAGQLNDLKFGVPSAGIKMGMIIVPAASDGIIRHGGMPGGGYVLSNRDFGRVISLFWDLVIEGIVRPGIGDGQNNDLPFFHVTAWGREAIRGGQQTPYDPDGYIRRLQTEVPTLDAVILTYLNESLRTFRIGCLLSSTIALGCASEKAFLLLIAAYADSLGAGRQRFKEKTDGRMIKRQFEDLRRAFDGELRPRLDPDLEDGLDVELNGLFDFIRTQRNDAGHPTGRAIERERAYANLVVFPVYVRKVYALIEWLAANPKS